MIVTLTMTLPEPALSPNSRVYFMKKARAVKDARMEAHIEAVSQMNKLGIGTAPRWKKATMKAKFYFKENRRRDRSNLAASLKAHEDGLTDAGIWEDDSGVTHLPPEILIDKKNPRLELEIEGTDES